jgi:tRNA 2-selenouridine synthase
MYNKKNASFQEAFFLAQTTDFCKVRSDQLPVEEFLSSARNNLLIDVRSPAEYKHAHIPGAVNIPIFNNEERSVIGTLYKQQSREAAIKAGLDFLGPKMKKIVEEVEQIGRIRQSTVDGQDNLSTHDSLFTNHNSILVYCWRGGMRSSAFAWLLGFYGFKVNLLIGGYKAYRNYVLNTLQLPFQFNLIGGYTGSGKTELLQDLRSLGEKVIDLEQLASHKGSAFGNINMPPQPTQEMFENLLSGELLDVNRNLTDSDLSFPFRGAGRIWIEDESQRIGQINIPHTLWHTLRTAPIYFLEIPFEKRLQHIITEYGNCDKARLLDAIERISKQLGGVEAKEAIELLQEENIEACFSILLKYYDKRYSKALKGREDLSTLLTTIYCTSVGPENVNSLLRKPAMA